MEVEVTDSIPIPGRFALGAFVLYALCAFCRAVARRFNSREMGDALRLITATQFHFIYYSSRPLPNTFALIPVLLSYERVLNGRYNAATVLATTTVVLFRSELVLLYGPLYLVGVVGKVLNSLPSSIRQF